MQVAIVGLGRMGKNVALHLLEQGVEVIAYNRSRAKTDELVVEAGAIPAYTLAEIVTKATGPVAGLSPDSRQTRFAQTTDDSSGEPQARVTRSEYPIVVILFVPSGAAVDEVLFGAFAGIAHREKDAPREKVQPGLVDLLPKGSIIIDGGNSFFKDSKRRYLQVQAKGLYFLDMGTSGGLEGARTGACLMVGGDEAVFTTVEPLLAKIATKNGYGYFGPAGTGHYVKMIHNAIEYGMMGAIGEGFNLVRSSKFEDQSGKEFSIDTAKLARVWAHGSIVSGLLMNKAQVTFEKDPQLESIEGVVPRGETEVEMEWLEHTGIPNPVIQTARQERVETRKSPSFIGKVIAALRREFGGHSVTTK